MKKKQFKSYETKSIPFELKDLDSEGHVKIALSKFDVMDSDFDVIRKGAFKKSLQERGASSTGRKIAHLRHHDWTMQIGDFKELYETDEYLIGVSKLARNQHGQDAQVDYEDGLIREHSIGFNYIADKIKFVEDSEFNKEGHFEVTEVKLYEGSAVLFGANEFTPTLEKGATKQDVIAVLNEEMELLIGAIKNGKGSDERLENIELRFKILQRKYNELINYEPFEKPNTHEKPEQKSTSNSNQFLKNLKL